MINISPELRERLPEKIPEFNVDLKTFISPETGKILNPTDYEYKLIEHICNGKKMSNMDEFIAVRQEFEATGKYTAETPARISTSKYTKFWEREVDRCINGYHAGYDSIPGYYYWYLNYSPIIKVEKISDNKKTGRSKGKRVVGFPNIWDSDYLWFHYLEEAEKRGQHAANIKSRGKGYSWKGASMLNRNFYLIPNSKSYAVAADWGYLTGKDGILLKTWEQQAFIDGNTEFRTRKLKDTDTIKESGYIIKNSEGVLIKKGLKSSIIGISLNNNADNIRGIRGKLILFEESGNNAILDKTWAVARSSVEQDSITYGLMVAFGTGGSEGARFETLNKIIRYPENYNIYGVPNIFETGRFNTRTAFFVGDYMNKEECYDEKTGTSDIVKAIEAELKERNILRGDPKNLKNRQAEHPINIEEATLQKSNNTFDVVMARKQIAELETNRDLNRYTQYGFIKIDKDNRARFEPDFNARYIDSYPTTDKEPEGCIAIYEHPKVVDGHVPFGIYIAGTDPVDFDRDEVKNTYSLASTFVMNVLSGNIVAEYTGRTKNINSYFENLKNLLIYYNARSLYEGNIRGLYVYFTNNKVEHLLAPEPRILRDSLQYTGAPLKKGYKANAKINAYNRQLLNSWSTEAIETVDKDGNVTIKHRMEYIRSKPLLQEMADWTVEGNFDRVSAMGALLLFHADLEKSLGSNAKSEYDKVKDSEFWNRAVGYTKKTRTNITGIDVKGNPVIQYT